MNIMRLRLIWMYIISFLNIIRGGLYLEIGSKKINIIFKWKFMYCGKY